MKITITNAYTWYNKGDAGILLGIINSLKKIYGNDIEINVLSFTPKEDEKRYCKDKTIKKIYSNILNPYPYRHTYLGKTIAIIKLLFKMIWLYLISKISLKSLIKRNKEFSILNDSDLILVCGGGFLGGKKYIDTLFNKKVIMMGTSIEPMKNGFLKKVTETIISKLDFVFARENITYDYLKTFMPLNKIEIIPDMAFMLDDNKNIDKRVEHLKKTNKYICGLTVRKWNFPNAFDPKEQMTNYINSVVDSIDYFYQNYCMIFVFVPQVIVENGNDIDVAYKIKEKLLNQDALVIIEDDITPIEIKTLISGFDIFVGTRMHSNIFATSMSIPTVAIAYEKKTNGIMQTVKLADYVIEIDNLNSKELIKKIKQALENKEKINNDLKKEIPKIREEIIKKLKKVLEEQ
jgi:colanic acid/amylovoran biosynthesis protein